MMVGDDGPAPHAASQALARSAPASVSRTCMQAHNHTTTAPEAAELQASSSNNDFIWLRWKDHRNGRAARAAYVSAGAGADLSEAGSAIASMEHLARAAELAMVLDDERDNTRQAIFSEIRRGLAADSLGHACFLAERSAKLLAGDVAEASRLADEFVAAADRAKATRQYHRDRSYSETAEVLAKAIADTARAARSRERLAISFEAEARAALPPGPSRPHRPGPAD